MNPRWLWRAALWVRRPPSAKRRWTVGIVLTLCAALFAVEYFIGWPESLNAPRMGMGKINANPLP